MIVEAQPQSEQTGIFRIEQAQVLHIPLIFEQLERIGKRETPEQINEVIQSSDNSVFVEADKKIVCRIRRGRDKKRNYVDWLLPQNELKVELYLVMCETLMDISRRNPQDDDFFTQARFKTGRGCLSILDGSDDFGKKAVDAFHGLFPNSSQFKKNILEGAYYIWGKQGEIVADIEANPIWQKYQGDKDASPLHSV